MNKITTFLLFSVFFFSFEFQSLAQCNAFARKNKAMLGEYVHDGSYNALKLKSGQTALLKKTFYQGQKYRISVCGSDELSSVNFAIKKNKELLYCDDSKSLKKIWDFSVESTTTLTIAVSVPKEEPAKSACISVLFGFRTSKELIEKYKK